MAVNQYVPKYIDCKIIKKKNNGDRGFLEKDHLNSIEDSWLQKDTRIGNSIIPSGTSLIDVINQVADEAIIGKNRIDSISVNHITQPIDINKNVDITVPTKLSDISEDSEHRVVSDNEKNAWNLKQNAVSWQSNNYDPINNKAITKSDLDVAIAPLARTTHWRGVFNSLDEVTNPQNGDVAAVGYKEYVYCADQEPASWRELGDENSYIHKGEVTNSDIKDDASISQSKIAGLVDALAEKVVKEVGKSLVLDTEIAKIHSHDNKAALDNITQTAWDTVVTNSNQVPNKVDKSTTIAGVDLQDNVTKEEMLAALNVEDGAQVNKIESINLNGTDLTIDSTTKKASGLVKSTLPIPNEISYTQMTSLQFCNAICDLDTCKVGVIYCGYSRITDAPCNGCEVTLSVMKDESTTYLPRAKVLILKMNSTNHHEKNWITMYHNEEMKFGTSSCPWEAELLTPVSTSDDSNDWIGASRKYVDDSIKSAIQNIIYEDNQGGHIKIGDNYTLNISPTGVITATYPTV